jgi:hypothetical protein
VQAVFSLKITQADSETKYEAYMKYCVHIFTHKTIFIILRISCKNYSFFPCGNKLKETYNIKGHFGV